MQAKDLIKILEKNPELFVKVAESKKHDDNAPTMEVMEAEIVLLEEADENIFLLWIEPNPDTIIKPKTYKMSSEDYPI